MILFLWRQAPGPILRIIYRYATYRSTEKLDIITSLVFKSHNHIIVFYKFSLELVELKVE